MNKKSKLTRRRFLANGAAALVAPAILPAKAFAASNEIRVGWVSPTTGPLAGFGRSDNYVVNSFANTLNKGVNVGGKNYKIKLIRKDSQSNPNRAAEVASELILDDRVHLMLSSSVGDTVLPVADQCELNGVPSISADTPWDSFFFGRGGDPKKGFDFTYHFFWGGEQIINSYVALWDQLKTNKKVGLMLANDTDGVALSSPEVGFATQIRKHGYEVVDLGLFEPMSDDFSAQIGKLKDADVDIITGIFAPPDWITFWAQAKQQGFKPKAATIAKALLFPEVLEAIGPSGVGLSSEVWWSPSHPYKSSVTGQSSSQYAAGYEKQTGKQWIQPMGFKHALLEVALDVLKRSSNPKDPTSIVNAIKATNIDTIVGNVNFSNFAIPNVSPTPVTGGQWVKGKQFPFDLAIAENKYASEIPVQAKFKSLK